jgi:ribonuclease E
MINKKIIIDGLYKDDITVVMLKNGVIDEFRHENSTQNFIQGNIYLGKIEKIEPALQAAFVNYGNGRSGFIKLSDIHPKYYDPARVEKYLTNQEQKEEKTETTNDIDEGDVASINKQLINHNPSKYVPIHNLVKVDQTLLVQIEKDERGSKGASLTTFLSLSGRYCVLILNSNKSNIISKTIEDEDERKRLRDIADELSTICENASIMIKPSAAYKTKLEIATDFGYLMRLWQNIEKCAEGGQAPLFIHEEGDIIKKSIRDLYDSEVSEIIVSGKAAYENAHSFMKLLMPKYIGKVKYYKGVNPIFIEYNLHDQIKSLYTDTVSLPSGGYLVINQTEALTSIDVNSGRSTGNYSIEETGKLNNLEAAREAVKQIKLRNISGLIIIDFIDIHSQDVKDTIEKLVKDGLASQNTRALVSKMGDFCLMEISRQRLGNSLAECVFHKCRECNGRGRIRSFELTAVAVLKAIREEISLANDKAGTVVDVGSRKEIIMDLINDKKKELADIEEEFSIKINLRIDESASLDTFYIERKTGKSKASQYALSTIDRTYYFSDEKKKSNKKGNGSKENGIPIVQIELQKSWLRKLYDKVKKMKLATFSLF